MPLDRWGALLGVAFLFLVTLSTIVVLSRLGSVTGVETRGSAAHSGISGEFRAAGTIGAFVVVLGLALLALWVLMRP